MILAVLSFKFVLMKHTFLIVLIFPILIGFGQDKKIDNLEILYDQGYYAKVSRKASVLLANPEYDYSGLPAYYKALALFRLSDNPTWFNRHNDAISQASELYKKAMSYEKSPDYVLSHYAEIAAIKSYLGTLETKFEGLRLTDAAAEINDFRLIDLAAIKAGVDVKPSKTNTKPTTKKEKELAENDVVNKADDDNSPLSLRDKMVVYAKSLLGVKYCWAGADPSGFDCSGFVSYVYKKYGIIIPRTAASILADSKQLNFKEAQKGDLLFFASGKNISHVGMIITEKGQDFIMVHASTSKGVILTEIEGSNYWKPKLKAAGTFI